MAKSSRASSRKANNQRLKAKVFGPVEAARAERLSAKLMELASQPKPERPEASEMKIVDEVDEANVDEDALAAKGEGDDSKNTHTLFYGHHAFEISNRSPAAMDVDTGKLTTTPSSSKPSKGRILKRKKKSSKVVFPMYKDKKSSSKRKH